MKANRIIRAVTAVLFALSSSVALASESFWVFFTDKAIVSEAEYQTALAGLAATYNPEAIERRQLRGTGDALFGMADMPVADAYVQGVLGTGARLRVESSWLNAISIEADASQVTAIAALPFVDHLQPVARLSAPEAVVEGEAVAAPLAPFGFYGSAEGQLTQINIPAVHQLGYTGAGVTIGVLDTGFVRTHQAFNEAGHVLNVIAEYDFLNSDGDTSDTTNGQHQHGTYILGTMGGYRPNTYVGGAYDAAFLLAKTESVPLEAPFEEDLWVDGLEWLEANGADLVTSSLGYIDWYTQAQLNGNTAVTTIAADLAAALGLPIINAAGNAGHDANPLTSSLIAPADGDLVITVGAVDSAGNIAGFSSSGPTADGRIKPEVLALGVGTLTVNPNSTTSYLGVSGTSLSTPLVAAAVALIVQAHPTWTVAQIREALFATASQALTPDPLFVRGYGIINTLAAVNYSFESESLVPEPSLVALLLLGVGLTRRFHGGRL